MPALLLDLDTFVVEEPDAQTIEIGMLMRGQPRPRSSLWLPWRRPAAREEDMRAVDAPTMRRRSPSEALAVADGHYVILDGVVVRSTAATPVLCAPSTQAGTCGKCIGDRLELAGIGTSDAAHIHSSGWWRDPAEHVRERNAVYVEAEPGTFLVQRHGADFSIVAGNFKGVCSGSW
jgi:hypothetical protein